MLLLSLLVKKINFVRCTEPSASPREVTAIATGSRILQVSWKVCKRHVFAIYDTTFFVIYWNLWCFFQFSLPFLFRYEPMFNFIYRMFQKKYRLSNLRQNAFAFLLCLLWLQLRLNVTFGTARRGLTKPQPAQAHPRRTKFNSPPINGHVLITVLLYNGPMLCSGGSRIFVNGMRSFPFSPPLPFFSPPHPCPPLSSPRLFSLTSLLFPQYS